MQGEILLVRVIFKMVTSGRFSWIDASPIISHYFNFWPDGEDRIWLKKIWPVLDKSGAFIYHTSEEEMACREKVGFIAIWYNECAHVFESGYPGEFKLNHLSEKLLLEASEPSSNCVGKELTKIRDIIIDAFGMMEAYKLTLRSCIEGSNYALDKKAIDSFFKEAIKHGDEVGNWLGWFCNSPLFPYEMETNTGVIHE